jgi:hypothetical protein
MKLEKGAGLVGGRRHDFDQALIARRIPTFTEEMLAEDLESIRALGSR